MNDRNVDKLSSAILFWRAAIASASSIREPRVFTSSQHVYTFAMHYSPSGNITTARIVNIEVIDLM
jgi:hypothetical protein